MWDCEYAASKRDGLCASATHSQTIWAGSIWKIIPSLIMEAWNENILIPQIFEYFHIFIRLAWGCGSQRLDQQIVFVRCCEWLEAHNTLCVCVRQQEISELMDRHLCMLNLWMTFMAHSKANEKNPWLVSSLTWFFFFEWINWIDAFCTIACNILSVYPSEYYYVCCLAFVNMMLARVSFGR